MHNIGIIMIIGHVGLDILKTEFQDLTQVNIHLKFYPMMNFIFVLVKYKVGN